MPSQPIPGKAYKTTEAQRAYAVAQRRAQGIGPRVLRDPAEVRAGRNARQREALAAFRAAFVGPLRPRAGRCLHRRTPEAMAESARLQHQTRRTSFVGPPKPEAIATAQRRAIAAERQRLKMAKVRAEFVGPLRPRGKLMLNIGLPNPPRTTRTPKVPKTTEVHQAAAQTRELAKAGRDWDAESYRVIRRAVVALQKLRTAERRRAWQAEYDRKRSMTDEERDAARAVREASRAKLRALEEAENAQLLARLEAERQAQQTKAAERATRRAEAETEAQACAARLMVPVRRVAFVRPTTPPTN